MAIKNSFVNATTNRLSRNFGGTVAGVADPYLTGYHFIYFANFHHLYQNILVDLKMEK